MNPNEPRTEYGKPLLIAGLRRHFAGPSNGIAQQWSQFAHYLGNIPGQIGRVAYGLCFLESKGLDYLSGVEVSSIDSTPPELSWVMIPAQTYAVFSHNAHVSKLRETLDAIEHDWLPSSGHIATEARPGAPRFFERYGEAFDPKTGMGDIEVWIPIRS
ncbi:MAG TPA: GyrI-like domain-containing protein [Bryobacteraceae bacterium]|jgi:AraC family transcriptional regulator